MAIFNKGSVLGGGRLAITAEGLISQTNTKVRALRLVTKASVLTIRPRG